MRFSELMPVLQMAVGPVILISGVGLLLLSMTNRFARVIDRTRLLAQARRAAPSSEKARHEAQLNLLRRRARLLQRAIILAVFSLLGAAILVIAVFLAAWLQWNLGGPIVLVFLASMASLIASLLVFLRDLNLSLEAMNLDVDAG